MQNIVNVREILTFIYFVFYSLGVCELVPETVRKDSKLKNMGKFL